MGVAGFHLRGHLVLLWGEGGVMFSKCGSFSGFSFCFVLNQNLSRIFFRGGITKHKIPEDTNPIMKPPVSVIQST